MPEFDSQDVLAAAVAAYELNGNRYFKSNEFGLDSYTIDKWANKEILKAHFKLDHYSDDATRPPVLSITEAHSNKAKEIKKFTAKSIFGLISKGATDNVPYEQTVYIALNKEKVINYDFGIIASAPFYYDNSMKAKALMARLDSLDSNWVGSVSNKIVLANMEIIKKHHSITYDSYIVHGICDNNLFMFFLNQDSENMQIGGTVSISAKVKSHVMEKDKYQMTRLYYVRELKK
jgi:hypothetical protein